MPIKPSDEKCEEIKLFAVNTLLNCNVRKFPICANDIANKLQINVIDYTMFDERIYSKIIGNNEDGFLAYKNCCATIFYNNNANSGRKNFTIMHEIGHFILGHNVDGEIEEAEANLFAKYILVPPPVLNYYIETLGKNFDILDISEKFGISVEAADYAFKYYLKWKAQFNGQYKDYEEKLLDHFQRNKQF